MGSWDCQSISSTGGQSGCRSFDEQIGVNTWRNSQGYVWYFQPTYFAWLCIAEPQPFACTSSSFSSSIVQGWNDLSTGNSVSLSYAYPAGTSGTVTCNGAGTTTTGSPTSVVVTADPTSSPIKSPTESPIEPPTMSPTPSPTPSPTNNPTPSPTDAPLTPGSPTFAPSESTPLPTRSPTDSPTDRPSYSPVKAPTFQPTKVGDTNHPTMYPVDVQNGYDCVTVTGSDNFDGDWIALDHDSSFGQVAYKEGDYYLYYAESAADGGDKFWTFSQVIRADSFDWGWCSEVNILDCSGNLENKPDARFTECGQSVSSQPTPSPNASGNNGDGDGNGDGDVDEEAAETILPGVDNNVFYLIISVVVLCGCCVLLMCCFICWRNKQMGSHTFDEKVSGHGNDW